ncbi:MAG: TSUP family transporter [Planctomycetota bacterium]
MNNILLLAIGLVAGILSGLLGIGGGIIMVPALIFLLGFSQHSAQGTTLAMMVPPIGLLAAWWYYSKGYVDIKVAGLMCIGFFIGGLLGAKFASAIPDLILKRIFGVALMLISVKMIFGK